MKINNDRELVYKVKTDSTLRYCISNCNSSMPNNLKNFSEVITELIYFKYMPTLNSKCSKELIKLLKKEIINSVDRKYFEEMELGVRLPYPEAKYMHLSIDKSESEATCRAIKILKSRNHSDIIILELLDSIDILE